MACLALLALAAAGGCSGSDAGGAAPASLEAAWEPTDPSQPVTLPDGFVVDAEQKTSDETRARGMMYRPSIPEGKGMLFIFPDMQPRAFWMYATVVPLDIIWMDDNKQVVEISANTPPCPARDLRECPTFGGSVDSVYVLELGAGQAAKHGVEVGATLEF